MFKELSDNISGIIWHSPNAFFLFIPLGLYVIWYLFNLKKQFPSLAISDMKYAASIESWRTRLFHTPFVLRVLGISFLIVAIARPQTRDSWENISVEGIDIMFAMDISSSMLAKDFEPNRLEASKEVAREFILKRPNDRIGLAIFAGESFPQSPLTTDHSFILNMFEDLEIGMLEDGTAIGMGLASSVNRLKESDAKSKVVILLTDGVNNKGTVDPMTAAELANTFDVRVYTIGVGTQGEAMAPAYYRDDRLIFKRMPVEIDEETLKKIADMTDGKYYRATDKEKMKEIYAEIDQLERTRIQTTQYSNYKEYYYLPTLIGVVLIFGSLLSRYFIFNTMP